MDEFTKEYNALAAQRHLYMSLKEITAGIPRWRLHILEKDTAPNGGDMEILCIEAPTKKECLSRSTKMLKRRAEIEPQTEEKAT